MGFNPKHNKVYNTLQEISRQFPDLSLGLTKNPFIKRVPAIAVVEIKPFGGDEAEGFSQLAIGLSSLLERTRQLQTLQGTDTHSILPVVGILITGHTWSTYIAFRGYWGNNERTVRKIALQNHYTLLMGFDSISTGLSNGCVPVLARSKASANSST